MGSSSSNASGMADYVSSMGALNAGTMANIGNYAHPERFKFDYNKLSDLMNTQAKLAYYQNKAAEYQTNPTLAAARDQAQSTMVKRYNDLMSGNLDSGTQAALTKAGLMGALQAGTVPRGDTSVGAKTAGQIFGQDLYGLQNQAQNSMNQYMMMNPEIQAALSPQALAQGVQATDNANTTQWNNWLNNLTNLATGSAANTGNAMGSAMEAAINAQNANASGSNSIFGSLLGAGSSLAGAGLTAAAIAGGFCYVAEELYGKEDDKTKLIRGFCGKHVNDEGFLGDFLKLYKENGRRWANEIKHNDEMRRSAYIVWGTLYDLAKEDE